LPHNTKTMEAVPISDNREPVAKLSPHPLNTI